MASAKKLPSGNWRVLLYVGVDENGKRAYESITAETKAKTELLAAQRKEEIEEGKLKERKPTEMTVGEAIDRYIDDREETASPKTIREYRGYRKRYMQKLMPVKIRNLTDNMIQLEINREGKRLAPKSVYNAWGLVRSALNAVDPDRHYRVKLPQRDHKEMQIPTNTELARLFEYVEGKRLEIPVIIAATCGLRRGEISALNLDSDVNYDTGEITVSKAVANTEAGEWIIKEPKTRGSRRTIKAPAWVIEKLRKARDEGYEAMSPGYMSAAFAKACDRLGIDIRLHDLRHYYASLMLSLGIPDKYAMAQMGHSTPNMLKTVYQHIMEDKREDVSKQITDYFENMQHDMQHKKNNDSE